MYLNFPLKSLHEYFLVSERLHIEKFKNHRDRFLIKLIKKVVDFGYRMITRKFRSSLMSKCTCSQRKRNKMVSAV